MLAINTSQQRALTTAGTVVVTAGAGTGKTRTLVERCLSAVLDPDRPSGLDRLLVVTFTEAAATEMRRRIRQRLTEEAAARPDDAWLAEQVALVDTAAIGTLHGFCARLIREHFHELALDPDVTVLDEGRAAIMRQEVLNAVLERHYGGTGPLDLAFRTLVQTVGRGAETPVAELIQRLHEEARARPHSAEWLNRQLAAWEERGSVNWFELMLPDLEQWWREWRTELNSLRGQHARLAELADLFERPRSFQTPAGLAGFLREAAAFGARGVFPRGETSFRKPVDPLIAEAGDFLEALGDNPAGQVLEADRERCREPMRALLELTREFMTEFARARREAATVDFSDLEHLALQLLEDADGRPGPVALDMRNRFDRVLVDEYQDINAVQDRLLAALSREGNEANQFLVGDLKQSIYGFRLADPRLFRDRLARAHEGRDGTAVPLQENYRSHPAILEFVNDIFAAIMQPELGGVAFDDSSRLLPGNPDRGWPDAGPPVEVMLGSDHLNDADATEAGESGEPSHSPAERTATEAEAAAVASRLRELHENALPVLDESGEPRPVRWSDMVVLLRSPSGRAEAYAKVFEQVGVPLSANRTGLFRALECLDLLNLLRLLDNPLQDLPLLAVLRSPLVGMTINELAVLRLSQRSGDCWTALARFAEVGPESPAAEAAPNGTTASELPAELRSLLPTARAKAVRFLRQHARWRDLARQTSLSDCLEDVLTETHYEAWLLIQPRGTQRRANVRRLLDLARDFDQFQRQSVHRFLRFVEAQQEAEFDPEPAAAEGMDAVRLMSIHKSKGLEFPVVVVANLAGPFNETSQRQPVLADEHLGLCPSVDLSDPPRRHPTLPLRMARRRQAADLRGEELRLLYVALTRASQKLILTGWSSLPDAPVDPANTPGRLSFQRLRNARRPLDWLMPLLQAWSGDPAWYRQPRGRCNRFAWRMVGESPPASTPASDDPPAASMFPAGSLDELAAVCSRTRLIYPHQAATREPAKTSVTTLRQRTLEEDPADEAEVLFPPPRTGAFPALRLEPGGQSLSPAERGTAHHRFLQYADLNRLQDRSEIERQAARLLDTGRLTREEADSLDPTALAAFGQSPLADRLRDGDANVRRELEFTLRLEPGDAAALGLPTQDGLSRDEGIVVQGVVDVAVFTGAGIWILDFKTDAVTETTVSEKVAAYTPQLALYAMALNRIFQRPITGAWLHFLAVNQSAPVDLPAICHPA
jgi:ATP-dependent helicase/nuclease subunit A